MSYCQDKASEDTTWSLALVALTALWTCIVMWGKRVRPCVVSGTRLLCLMKCKTKIDTVKFFIKIDFFLQKFCLLYQIWQLLSLPIFLTGHYLPLSVETWECRRFYRCWLELSVWFCPPQFGRFCQNSGLRPLMQLISGSSRSPQSHEIFFLSFKTNVEASGSYSSLVCSSSTNDSSMCQSVIAKKGTLISPLSVVFLYLYFLGIQMGKYCS